MPELDKAYVKDFMQTNVITVLDTDPITKAASKMLKSRIHSVVVVDQKGNLKGIVSSFDLVKITFMPNFSSDIKVEKMIEKQELITISPETSLYEALKTMVLHNIRKLPVVENGTLAGVISMFDIAKFMIEE